MSLVACTRRSSNGSRLARFVLALAVTSASLGLTSLAFAEATRGTSGTSEARETSEETSSAPAVEYADRWKGLGFGSYLAPKGGWFIHEDGGVDVVFHFHAGQMSEREMRDSGLGAVFVSCGFGIGSGAYSAAFRNPARFDRMLAEVIRNVERDTGRRSLHVRKVALAAWSAGFAAVGKILGVERYYAMVDSVILLDGLHAQYRDPKKKTPSQGEGQVDVAQLRSFIRFAADAAAGHKSMTITHSSIVPPDYASTTEAAGALLTAIDVTPRQVSETNARGMSMSLRADAGSLRVQGFRGRGPKDHFEHLHLLGEALRSSVVPRWSREAGAVYTQRGDQF